MVLYDAKMFLMFLKKKYYHDNHYYYYNNHLIIFFVVSIVSGRVRHPCNSNQNFNMPSGETWATDSNHCWNTELFNT